MIAESIANRFASTTTTMPACQLERPAESPPNRSAKTRWPHRKTALRWDRLQERTRIRTALRDEHRVGWFVAFGFDLLLEEKVFENRARMPLPSAIKACLQRLFGLWCLDTCCRLLPGWHFWRADIRKFPLYLRRRMLPYRQGRR